jgi:WD40 repeat protein
VETGKELLLIKNKKPNSSPLIAFSSDGKTLVWVGLGLDPKGREYADGSPLRVCLIQWWDIATKEKRDERKLDSDGIMSLCLSPDGKLLARADGELTSLGEHKKLTTAAFTPDGRMLATGDAYVKVRIWEAGTGKEVATLKSDTGDLFQGLCFSQDGKTLVTGSMATYKSQIRIWEGPEWKEKLAAPAGNPWAVAVSPNGATVFYGGSGRARLWEIGVRSRVITTVTSRALAVSPDGKKLAVSGASGVVYVYDVSSIK